MHILLSGKSGSPVDAVGEELKNRWAELGTAVFVHNARGPALLMRDALHSVAVQFGYSPAVAEEDLSLQQALLEWGREKDQQFWGKAARRIVDKVTSTWEEKGMFHVAVIKNLSFREDFELFPRAFRVYLLPPDDHKPHMIHSLHSSETSLDQWVTASRESDYPVFDLVLWADEGGPVALARSIFDGFNERFKSGFRTLMH
jgi:hypothetical protein